MVDMGGNFYGYMGDMSRVFLSLIHIYVADVNFDNETMQQAMIDAMKYWVTEIGLAGYRCDYAEGVPDRCV